MIAVEHVDSTRVITIRRPDRMNALDPDASHALSDAIHGAQDDDTVRVVVLTGEGTRAFCAGMDLKVAAEVGSAGHLDVRGGFGGVTHAQLPKPLIAAVNGVALGGGFEMVLACDLVVAAESARFGLPEVLRGRIAGSGGLVRLGRSLPPVLARELAFTGEPIDAVRALAIGLCNRVVPADQLVPTALELATSIARGAPLAIGTSKRILDSCELDPPTHTWELSDRLARELRTSNDADEGLRAYAEGRAPRWTAT